MGFLTKGLWGFRVLGLGMNEHGSGFRDVRGQVGLLFDFVLGYMLDTAPHSPKKS